MSKATARELVGGWRLVSWSYDYPDGRPAEYPMGTDAEGLILYTDDGHVSATLMRPAHATSTPSSDLTSFAYAGRYEVIDGTVYHSIAIATDASLVGVRSTRHITLDGDRLTLSGPDFKAGSPRTQRIVWRRATERDGV